MSSPAAVPAAGTARCLPGSPSPLCQGTAAVPGHGCSVHGCSVRGCSVRGCSVRGRGAAGDVLIRGRSSMMNIC